MDHDVPLAETEGVGSTRRRLASNPMTREEVLALRGAFAIGDLPDDPPTERSRESAYQRLPSWVSVPMIRNAVP